MFKNVISKRAIIYPLLMLSAMWFGYFLQMQGFFGSCFGAIIPLLPEGLLGVVTSPLLHGNIDHIIGNSIPIAALMFLLYQFYPLVANKVLLSDGLLQDFWYGFFLLSIFLPVIICTPVPSAPVA